MKDPFDHIFHKGISNIIMEMTNFNAYIGFTVYIGSGIFTTLMPLSYKYLRDDCSVDMDLLNENKNVLFRNVVLEHSLFGFVISITYAKWSRLD